MGLIWGQDGGLISLGTKNNPLSVIREFDMNIIIKMFNSLKEKIHKANQEGLTSLN